MLDAVRVSFANPRLAAMFSAHARHEAPEDESVTCIWDSRGWKRIQAAYPDLFEEARNVFIGACVDGVNPFSMMVVRSMLCIVFVWYNFPSQLRGTYENMEVWGIVDGKVPNAQLVMRVLRMDLETLWKAEGQQVWDGDRKAWFQLRGMLVNMMHDYPGFTSITNQYGTGAHQGCVKCTINGVKTPFLKKSIYAHRLQPCVDHEDHDAGATVLRDHKSVMDGAIDLQVRIRIVGATYPLCR
jgi:hypothetical protein